MEKCVQGTIQKVHSPYYSPASGMVDHHLFLVWSTIHYLDKNGWWTIHPYQFYSILNRFLGVKKIHINGLGIKVCPFSGSGGGGQNAVVGFAPAQAAHPSRI